MSAYGHCVVLVSVLGGVVLGRHHQTAALARAAVHRLDDVNHLLLVFQRPVDLVVVAGAQIYHNVLVAEEEHHRAGVIQLVHFIKVWYFSDIHEVYNGEVLDLLRDAVQHFVHLHAGRIPVMPESYDNNTVFLRQYGLIYLPAVV
ncbi:unnamed protein product [Chrysodeixis includens]|uniref:Secreted protein n=1 Tax=Chrysodeixis includens TaxID=689277 RepID=A0A9N8L493_CHRIL|nr:unnamed protein product [Chrysodeixis includens]